MWDDVIHGLVAELVNGLNPEQMPTTAFAFEFDGTIDFDSFPRRGGNIDQPRLNRARIADRMIDTIRLSRSF